MGQKIYLVAAAIIVGVALVLGLETADMNMRQANQDIITQNVLIIASRAQAWYRAPAQMGGGGRSFSKLTLARINSKSDSEYGTFELTGLQDDRFQVRGIGYGGRSIQVMLEVFPDSVSQLRVVH